MSIKGGLAAAVTMFGVLGAGATPSLAQVLPKPPDSAQKTPDYVPPPPPAVAPERPAAQTEAAAPNLAIKEASGKLKRYTPPLELEALKLLNIAEPEAKAKIEASLKARHAEIDRQAMEKLGDVVEAMRAVPKLAKGVDMEAFEQLRQLADRLVVENPGERLVKDGAITPSARGQIARSVAGYEEALGQEQSEETGVNFEKIMTLIAERVFTGRTHEIRTAIEARAGLVAAKPVDGSALNLTPEQKPKFDAWAGEFGLAKGATERGVLVQRLITDVLTVDQARTLLASVEPTH